MSQVTITDFRAHLPIGEVPVTARERLLALRKKARIGDVVTPIGVSWNATHDSA